MIDWNGRPRAAKDGRRGREIYWCQACGAFTPVRPGSTDLACATCGAGRYEMRCTRCGHTWYPRVPGRAPKTCPNPMCKSPYFNRERSKGMKDRSHAPATVTAEEGEA